MPFPPWLIPILVFSTVVILSYIINALRKAPLPPTQLTWDETIPIQWIDVDGVRLRYIAVGEGQPLVLLHTFRTQLDIFHKIVPVLARHFRVIALDYPGHGFSDIPKVDYTPTFLLQSVQKFLMALDIRNALVVGESIGGTLALLLAAAQEPRIDRAIAINPFDREARRSIMRMSWAATLVFSLTNVPLLGGTIWRLRPLPVFRRIMGSGVYQPGALTPELLGELYRSGHRPYHYRAFMSLIRHFPAWAKAPQAYHKITLPVCLVYGDQDWSLPADRQENAQLIPQVQVQQVAQAGHFLSLDAPEEVLRIISTFSEKAFPVPSIAVDKRHPAVEPSLAASTQWGRIGWRVMLVLAIAISLYTTVFYVVLPNVIGIPLGWQVHPALQRTFAAHPIGLYVHILPAIPALFLGPFQFHQGLRQRRPRVHRLLGRVYLGGILIGGLGGLYMAQFATGGLSSQVGFSFLALAWLFSGGMALYQIRHGQWQSHQEWMIRNYALTLAAVTLRLYTRTFFLTGLELPDFQSTNAWLCWVPNLMMAEWLIYRLRAQRNDQVQSTAGTLLQGATHRRAWVQEADQDALPLGAQHASGQGG